MPFFNFGTWSKTRVDPTRVTTVESRNDPPAATEKENEDADENNVGATPKLLDRPVFMPGDDDGSESHISVMESDSKDTSEVDLRKSCWTCHVDLQQYLYHEHPVLHTPICCLCIKDIEPDDEDACAACGDDDDVELTMCDSCSKGFCRRCLDQCGVPRELGDPWKCPCCDPTAKLSEIQCKETPLAKERTLEDAVHELANAENSKKLSLDQIDRVPEQTEMIHTELEAQGLSGKILQDAVRAEVAAWETAHQNNIDRLDDLITALQDEIENIHGLDLASFYKTLFPTQERADATEDLKAAEDAILKNEESLRNQAPTTVLDSEIYEEEIYEDVEELATPDQTFEPSRRTAWSSNKRRPTRESLLRAYEAEQESIAKIQIAKTSDSSDKKIIVEELATLAHDETGRQFSRPKKRRRIENRFPPKLSQPREQSSPNKRESDFAPTQPLTPREDDSPVATTFSPPRSPARHKASDDPVRVAQEVLLPPSLPQSKKNDVRPESETTVPAHRLTSSRQETNESDKVQEASFPELIPARRDMGAFRGSSFVLATVNKRQVTVATHLEKILKGHQKDGVRFLWNNCLCDWSSDDSPREPGGCILAHNMGLGKTLTTISFIHSALCHPEVTAGEESSPMVSKVLLVVPTNTIANWAHEFDKWIHDSGIAVHNLQTKDDVNGPLGKWYRRGGVALIGDRKFQLMTAGRCKEVGPIIFSPDLLVVDEAHTMLKKQSTETYKALKTIETKRKILLTGTPFQNNLFEYYCMCDFIRPGVFKVRNEAAFESTFVAPIENGQPSDATDYAKALAVKKIEDLNNLLKDFIHRVDVSVLAKELPPLTQAVIHVRQSRIQSRLYQAFQRKQKHASELKNFFRMFSELKPIHNHPYCLLKRKTGEDQNAEDSWWRAVIARDGTNLDEIECGFKIVLLLHVMAYSIKLGEKVLVFSQCLKTLDYIENVVSFPNWKEQVPSLSTFEEIQLGGWIRNKHYMRLDGTTDASTRGAMVNSFNSEHGVGRQVQAFFISSGAGSVGINLTAASRVVLLDSHFNPTVMTQAIFRAYRYGQSKPVKCYRFLTEGTIEEKVYGRSVNKAGMALRVIDKKSISRLFSKKELADLQEIYTWAQCDKCEKWRMLFNQSEDSLPDEWFCEMNATDPRNSTCDQPERSQKWYELNPLTEVDGEAQSYSQSTCSVETVPSAYVEDEILIHLLTVSEKQKGSSLVSRHYYHDALLASTQNVEELDNAKKYLEAHPAPQASIDSTSAKDKGDDRDQLSKDGHRVTSTQSKRSSIPQKVQASTTQPTSLSVSGKGTIVNGNTIPATKAASVVPPSLRVNTTAQNQPKRAAGLAESEEDSDKALGKSTAHEPRGAGNKGKGAFINGNWIPANMITSVLPPSMNLNEKGQIVRKKEAALAASSQDSDTQMTLGNPIAQESNEVASRNETFTPHQSKQKSPPKPKLIQKTIDSKTTAPVQEIISLLSSDEESYDETMEFDNQRTIEEDL